MTHQLSRKVAWIIPTWMKVGKWLTEHVLPVIVIVGVTVVGLDTADPPTHRVVELDLDDLCSHLAPHLGISVKVSPYGIAGLRTSA